MFWQEIFAHAAITLSSRCSREMKKPLEMIGNALKEIEKLRQNFI
jgi:hypothetical protein